MAKKAKNKTTKKQSSKKLKTYRVKLLSHFFNTKTNIIMWDLFVNELGTNQVFCFPASDLNSMFGIKYQLSNDNIEYFCNLMIDKEFNFQIDKEIEPPKKITEEEINKISKDMGREFDNIEGKLS